MLTGAAPTMRPDEKRAIGATIAVLLGVTLFRLASLWAGETQLSTDEAQYWLWGETFAFGAYSKPPMIGWIIAVSTAVLGETTWAVRAPAPLFHLLTGLTILALGLRISTPRVAALAALTYVTMPAVTLGSFLMTTDTPMLAASAVALLLQHVLAKRALGTAPTTSLSIALGAALAFGMLTKYAMLFAVAGMALAALVSPDWRMRRRDVMVAAVSALVLISPNLIWVASNNFVTVQHMADSSGIEGPKLHPMVALRFLTEQLAVFGPVVFAVWVWALIRVRHLSATLRGLVAASGAILLIVVGQAMMGKALANWAVGFGIAASLVFASKTVARPWLAGTSLAIGGFLAIALPVLTVWGTEVRAGDRLVLGRYLGQDDLVARAIARAGETGAKMLASDHRDILSALSWQGRAARINVHALAHDGPPRNYWEMSRPLPDARQEAVLVITTQPPLIDCGVDPLPEMVQQTAGPGFLEGHEIFMTTVSAKCRITGQP